MFFFFGRGIFGNTLVDLVVIIIICLTYCYDHSYYYYYYFCYERGYVFYFCFPIGCDSKIVAFRSDITCLIV